MLRLITFGRLAIEGRPSADSGEVRPRHLAVLAILASAGATGIAREQLQTILWGDKEPDRARHSLSQALYGLKRELGVETTKVGQAVRLEQSTLTSDLEDFHTADTAKDWQSAARLYAGPFLGGFYLNDAPEFERWVEPERAVLRSAGLRVIGAAAEQSAAEGRADQVVAYRRRLAELDPLNGKFAVAFAESLLLQGDRSAALQHAQMHASAVRRDLEMEPDAAVRQMIETLRDARGDVPLVRPKNATVDGAWNTSATTLTARPVRRTRWVVASIAFAAILVVALGWRAATTPRARENHPLTPVASRLYEDGLRAFYQFDYPAALRLFDAALNEDSTFAMAAYYAWRSESEMDGPGQPGRFARVASLATGADDRQRRVIIEHLAASRWNVSALAAADSLAARYPNDVEALTRAADVAPSLGSAAKLLDRAIALDSADEVASPTSACRLCESFRMLVARAERADSLALAHKAIDRWMSFRPDDYQPWNARAELLIAAGRRRDAEAALHRANALGAPRGSSSVAAVLRNLRLDDVDSVGRICAAELPTAVDTVFVQLRSLCTIGLRMQGKLLAALALIHDGRVAGTTVVRDGMPLDVQQTAILDLEMERARAASVAFSAMGDAARASRLDSGVVAHRAVWAMTLAATSDAIGGDTIRARARVDSIELIGHRSLDQRDPLLHHFVRGINFAVARQYDQAARELRESMAATPVGFIRINYELGRCLLASDRAADAVPVLRAALHANPDGENAFATRTDVHELLARAFAATNQVDSAAAHYAVVVRAWQGADDAFAQRRDAARRFLLRAGHDAR